MWMKVNTPIRDFIETEMTYQENQFLIEEQNGISK